MSNLVLPGDKIGSIEEYLKGEGVFEYNGYIYSYLSGILNINFKERIVNVKPLKTSKILFKGNKVIAKVNSVSKNFAECSIIFIEETLQKCDILANLYLGKRNFYNLLPNDYIRAKVINTRTNIILSIKEKEYGIIYADCNVCGEPFYLDKNIMQLLCKNCKNKRKVKISPFYLLVWK